LIDTGLDSAKADLVRANALDMIRAFEPTTKQPVKVQLWEEIQQQVSKKNRLDLVVAKVAAAAGILPYFEPVDLRDARVIERGERLRLAREACESLRIVHERIGQNLDRDVAVQPGVPRPIHLAHPAGAYRRHDLVRAEACASRKSHGTRLILATELLTTKEKGVARQA